MSDSFKLAQILNCSRLLLLFFLLLVLFLFSLQYGGVRGAAMPVNPVVAESAPGATGEVVRGVLLSVPLGGLGLWVIRPTGEQTQTVLVLDLQILEDGVLPTGAWVYANVVVQVGGLRVATYLRLDDYEPGQVVARLETGVLSSTIASRYQITPKSTVLASGRIYLFTTPQPDEDVEALVQQMQNDPDIVWAELNYLGSTPEGNPYTTWRWGGPEPSGYINQGAFTQVNLLPAQSLFQGDDVVVALLDTGIDLNHPALAGHWLAGYDMVADDATPQDEGPGTGWGHGTHIAGIIAHVAPNSKLLPLRVLDSEGRGNVFTLAYAIEWAVEHGADVINLSLGTDTDAAVLREGIAAAQAAGVVIAAAAGNNNTNSPQYPVAYDGVIGVTAVDSANYKAEFADYGAWVELAAPGVGITSTIIGPEGSGYASWSGTSMATGFVSGAAALARQKIPTAAPVTITQLLVGHAQPLNPENPGFIDQLGGLLDIGAALATATPTPTILMPTTTPTATLSATPVATPTPTAVLKPTLAATPTLSATPTQTTGKEDWKIYLPLLDR